MRVFVTGGSGLVGRHVVSALRERGDEVLALARSEASAAELRMLGADVLRGTMEDTRSLERGAGGADAVVHSAAIVLSRGDWEHYHATNVVPTERIARAAAGAAARLVHISSVAVYGRRSAYDGGANSVTEEFGLERPLFPGDHYARSKREAERAVWRVAAETGLSAVALRPCVVYGEGDRHFTSRASRLLLRGWAPLVGRGDNPLSVVYAGNVAAAVLAALDRNDVAGAFNVANDGTVTQREFLQLFARGMQVRLRLLRVPRRGAWSAAVVVDGLFRLLRPAAPMGLLKTAVHFLSSPNPFVSERARRELGWRPVVSAPDAVERTGRSFRPAGAA